MRQIGKQIDDLIKEAVNRKAWAYNREVYMLEQNMERLELLFMTCVYAINKLAHAVYADDAEFRRFMALITNKFLLQQRDPDVWIRLRENYGRYNSAEVRADEAVERLIKRLFEEDDKDE